MLQLKRVSKYYYNKGLITSGFNKINLELNLGEFVVITGESGSGKSTLLNVISGVDGYEEGEMYINGCETSHYNEQDFELYRKKYVSNIFQNFNLINSYTVYQNIELVLLINGYTKKEVKPKVLELISKVKLEKHKNKKVSKLSGGQKQRVAIARALAKDTPIIVADEPTGNLDVKSAKEIANLLSNIAKDKLVVIVTHNYDQFDKYATRKIKMHDGKIIEDKIIKKVVLENNLQESYFKKINFYNKLKISIRNTFNVFPKFLLLLGVFLFMLISISSEYTSLKKEEDDMSLLGYNQFFSGYDDNRVIVKKKDKTPIDEQDIIELNNTTNIKSINKYDVLLDSYVNIYQDEFYFSGIPKDINELNLKVSLGRMPEKSDEVIVRGSKNDYYLSDMASDILDKQFNLTCDEVEKIPVKIVGIIYDLDYQDSVIYMSNNILNSLKKSRIQNFSNIVITLNEQNYLKEPYSNLYRLVPNANIKNGEVYLDESMNSYCVKDNCLNSKISISINNTYYNDSIDLKIVKIYNSKNYEKLVNQNDYEIHAGEIYVSQEDYDYLFNKPDYQVSIYISDFRKLDNTINELSNKYKLLPLRYALANDGSSEFLEIFKVVLYTVLTVALFFIAYFVIKLILKSRNIYFSTMRLLGTAKKDLKTMMSLELINVATITYIIFLIFNILFAINVIKVNYIKELILYLKFGDYVLLYFIVIFMSYLISIRFTRSLFKKSALNKYREEV